MMRIAYIEPPSLAVQGDQIYRTVQPAHALSQWRQSHVVAGSWMHKPLHAAAESADVLVLCQAVDIDLLALMERRRQRGQITLMELNDNFLEPKSFGDVGNFYHDPAQLSLTLQLAARSHGLIVSTPYLAGLFGHLNKNLLVLPNTVENIDAPRQPQRLQAARSSAPKTCHEPIVRLGWAGSAGHREDLEMVMPALRAVLESRPHVTLCIMAAQALHPLFDWVPPSRLDLRPATDLEGYQNFIRTWDVGVAPLIDSPFNRGRSDVKFLEYARAHVAIVASHGPAYSTIRPNTTGLIAQGPDDFVALVQRLIDDPILRCTLSLNAAAYVRNHRLCRHISQTLVPFVARCLGHRAAAGSATSRRWFAKLTAGRPAHIRGRMAYLGYTGSEALLYRGIDEAQRSGCQAALHEARRKLPAFYLSNLYLGATQKDAAAALPHLSRAAAQAPHSLLSAYTLVHRLLRLGQLQPANDAAQQALALCGGAILAPLWLVYSDILQAQGQSESCIQARAAAVAANGHHAPAAQALAAALVALPAASLCGHPAVQVAKQALHQAQTSAAPHYANSFWLGRLASAQNLWPEALTQHLQCQALMICGPMQAAALRPSMQENLALLARAALNAGNSALAQQSLRSLRALAAQSRLCPPRDKVDGAITSTLTH